MSTEDPAAPGQQPTAEFELVIGGVLLHAGSILVLDPGDYFYDDDWLEPMPLCLVVTKLGTPGNRVGGIDRKVDEYVMVEGVQQVDMLICRPRAVAVRVSALAKALNPFE